MNPDESRRVFFRFAFGLALFAVSHAFMQEDELRAHLFGFDGFVHSSEVRTAKGSTDWMLNISTEDGDVSLRTYPNEIKQCVHQRAHLPPMGETLTCGSQEGPHEIPWRGILWPFAFMLGAAGLATVALKNEPSSPERASIMPSDARAGALTLAGGLAAAVLGMLLRSQFVVLLALWALPLSLLPVIVTFRTQTVEHEGAQLSWSQPSAWIRRHLDDPSRSARSALIALLIFTASPVVSVFTTKLRAAIPHGIMISTAGWMTLVLLSSPPSSPLHADLRARRKVPIMLTFILSSLAVLGGLAVSIHGALKGPH